MGLTLQSRQLWNPQCLIMGCVCTCVSWFCSNHIKTSLRGRKGSLIPTPPAYTHLFIPTSPVFPHPHLLLTSTLTYTPSPTPAYPQSLDPVTLFPHAPFPPFFFEYCTNLGAPPCPHKKILQLPVSPVLNIKKTISNPDFTNWTVSNIFMLLYKIILFSTHGWRYVLVKAIYNVQLYV